MPKVYVAMCADLIHPGHLNVINEGRKHGEIIVGLLSDKAMVSYKRLPFLSYEQRKIIVENIKGVSQVVCQDTLDYRPNLIKFKPEFIVHGDDWQKGAQREIRTQVIDTIKKWGGKLIEVPYTEGISSTTLNQQLKAIGTTPEIRMKRLKRLLDAKDIVRFLEAHNGLTGLIVEKTAIEKNRKHEEFDGIWISSLTDSIAKGKPDIELPDFSSRINTINNILEVTTKPIIVDGDTGGLNEHFVFTVRTLERLGISGIIIEDKTGLKKNSLYGTDVPQLQESIEAFSKKITAGKAARVTTDFMIIARIESLILQKGITDALKRASAYIEAGADAIMIHSKAKDPEEILNFCQEYLKFGEKVPLIAVPTTYCQITEKELAENGVKLVIYANHLLRSAYPAMQKVAKLILANSRSHEAEKHCMSINEILNLIPENN